MHEVFVYGTLLQGLRHHGVLAGAQCLGHAHLRGRLFDLGPYPALRPGPDRVRGEVYRVDAATLAHLDRLEGYDPQDPPGSLYRRVTRRAWRVDGEPREVLVYLYNARVDPRCHIPHGDYRQHLDSLRGKAAP
ncbi:gamma-glutamylcyclotransferase family protein [Ectothiorhodospira mobilis]|uniref:gamma-glutamylcyclotransferase family protein n=1 Tax=Ectothiorhodospira mobilis TaxID=195064 RepID=UPI001EE84992|nr:gamma-glutamylcyclotransferase [Ectothiorhodospira mobilis]MCG5536062.1 gamma-glutamylcyclotransferase [Ectothiorhodospira mobilis]